MVGKLILAVALAVAGGSGLGWRTRIHSESRHLAGDVVNQLQDWGYNVMLNGLDRDIAYMGETQKRYCQVLEIHPVVSEPLKSGEFQTVYVDLSCPGNPSSTTPSGN